MTTIRGKTNHAQEQVLATFAKTEGGMLRLEQLFAALKQTRWAPARHAVVHLKRAGHLVELEDGALVLGCVMRAVALEEAMTRLMLADEGTPAYEKASKLVADAMAASWMHKYGERPDGAARVYDFKKGAERVRASHVRARLSIAERGPAPDPSEADNGLQKTP